MACSRPTVLRTKPVACATLVTAALLASVALNAQDANRYILATRRSGAIEIIDPESLAVLGRIHFNLPSNSVGLNGISAGADGTTLYVEGPIPNMSNGCCVLYSIDLATLQTKQVAGIGGTTSRGRFITSNGITYQVAPPSGSEAHATSVAVDLYDPAQGKFVRYLAPSGLDNGWWRNGIRVHDQFVFYAAKGFSELIADREKGELYGISAGDPNWRSGIELVRMDAQDGRILQSRTLEDDYWRIAFAPLRTVPAADVRAVTSAKK
jgi:hypothetical protein